MATNKAKQLKPAKWAWLKNLFTLEPPVQPAKNSFHNCLTTARQIKNALRERDIEINPLSYLQNKGFFAALPKNINDFKKFEFEMPSSTMGASFCMYEQDLVDASLPLFLGHNFRGGDVIVNFFEKNETRKNFNVVILGTSGSGKSYLTTKIMNHHIALNRRVVCIDFENGFTKICNYYHGNMIKVANPKDARINPLQVFMNIATEDEVLMAGSLDTHILFLKEFCAVLFTKYEVDGSTTRNLSNLQEIFLEKAIAKTYAEKNVTDQNFQKLKNTDFPIFSDVVVVIEKWIQQKGTSPNYYFTQTELDEVKVLVTLLRGKLVDGVYASYFNHPSSLELTNNFTVINYYNCSDEKAFRNAQQYLTLKWLDNYVQLNDQVNDNQIVILIDEAHLMIDKSNPIALNFIYQMYKRIRKKKGSMVITTQNPEDFVASDDLIKKTQGILNNCQYLFVFKLVEANLAAAQRYLFNNSLNFNEENYILKAMTGECFFKASEHEKHFVKIEGFDYEEAVIEHHTGG